MELLIAFFVAFGVVSDVEEAKKLSEYEMKYIMEKDEQLQKDFVIWEAEGDDF